MFTRNFLRAVWSKKNLVAAVIIIISALLLHSAVFKINGFVPKDDWCFIIINTDRPVHPQIYEPILKECQRLGIRFTERRSDLNTDERSYWGD